MAFDRLCRFPAQLKNVAIRTSTRPVLDHPFVVAALLFLILLYRSSPFLFSLLLSASPVLVCTAVLLGTLLCFGDPQIPEIDKSLTAISLHKNTTNVSHEEMLAFDDHFEPSSLPWTRVNVDEEDEEYEPLDCGSDGAESSSPEPSMADIIPLLDEIDPLIECENSGLLSIGNRSHDSDEETDNKEAEEAAENDKEDAEKSAITWTEDDQKNLMDLGSSELERNQRLESLIARRRARRSMNESNAIDLPFQVPTISTTRRNPFDFPSVAYDDMGLPPVPGSAPSILLPRRRNPFDLPYDSSEEKPDLTGDTTFHQEYMQISQKEPVFRRHESFNIGSGSSFFQFPRKDGRFRPYFVADSSFMRQSSELSTSGVSESSSYKRQSSDVSSAAETEQASVEEAVPSSEMDHASVHVEHGSQSSQILDDQYENRDFDLQMPEIRLGEPETRMGTDFNQVEINLRSTSSGNDPCIETWLATNDRSSSSLSSLSEEEEEEEDNDFREVDEGFDQESSTLETNLMLETIEEEHFSSSSSSIVLEENIGDVSSSSHTMDLDDTHFEEPVYDSSPRALKIRMLEEFPESDVEQKRDGDQEVSESVQPDLLSLATELTEEPELVNEDALLSKEKLISVADQAYSPEDRGLANPYPSDSQEESFVIPEMLQVVEPQLSEIIDKPCAVNVEKSSHDVAFINGSVEMAESGIEEFTDPHVLELI